MRFSFQDGELFGIGQTFWDTPFTRKQEPVESVSHHLHAKRPASRDAVLRSSMVSGYLDNIKRYETVLAKVEQNNDRENALGRTISPIEYVDLLRRSYEEKRKQESDLQIEETKKPVKRKKQVRFDDSQEVEKKR